MARCLVTKLGIWATCVPRTRLYHLPDILLRRGCMAADHFVLDPCSL